MSFARPGRAFQLAGYVLVGVAIALGAESYRNNVYPFKWARGQWIATSAVVRHVTVSRSLHEDSYTVNVIYEYQAEGRKRMGGTYFFPFPRFDNAAAAQAFVSGYTPGMTVPIQYRSDLPDVSAGIRNPGEYLRPLALYWGALLAVGLLGMLFLARAVRASRKAA